MQYYGNLALNPERKPSEPARAPKRSTSPAPQQPRRRSIPVGEKLLYLMTVMVFVAVAGLVVYRYAGLYQTTSQIQATTKQYDQLVDESKVLQQEIDKLKDPSRIKKMALQYGLQPVEGQPITLSPAAGQTATATQP